MRLKLFLKIHNGYWWRSTYNVGRSTLRKIQHWELNKVRDWVQYDRWNIETKSFKKEKPYNFIEIKFWSKYFNNLLKYLNIFPYSARYSENWSTREPNYTKLN
jgi:hypothetical protein